MITNEIKAKVFAQYYEQSAFVRDTELPTSVGAILSFVWRSGNRGVGVFDINTYKLILKPLIKITDEDALWIRIKLDSYGYEKIHVQDVLNGLIDVHSCDLAGYIWLEIIQYLQSRGYDLPNYLLDGKTLEQSGLAIYEGDIKNELK